MGQQGDTGENQSGSISQDTRTRSAGKGKRSRGEDEELMHLAASEMADQCVNVKDLDLSSPSGGGKTGTDIHIFAVSEKRAKSENGDTVAASGIEEATKFYCDICCVNSSSAKDLKTHFLGKKHAKRESAALAAKSSTHQKSQALMGNTSTYSNASSQQAFMENVAAYLNANMGIISTRQQVVLDSLHNNLSQESIGHVSSAGGTDVEVMNSQASLSKCSDLDDANAVAVGQQDSIDVPSMETVNQVSKNDFSSRPALDECHVTDETVHCPPAPALDDGHCTNETVHSLAPADDFFKESNKRGDDGHVTNETVHSPSPADDFPKERNKQVDDGHVTNGTVHNLSPADDFSKESNKGTIFEGQRIKGVLASLNTRSNSDCVTGALASALGACTCPGLGDLQMRAFCGQAAGCSDSQAAGAMSADSHGMVEMHAHCFVNLLHDVRTSAIEDLFRHVVGEERNGGLAMKTWLPNAAPVSGSACDGESEVLNCTVCRVEYGSNADLDLHLAGKRHTSLVGRLGARCQVCNLNCSSERDFETHLSGRKHASKLRLLRKRVAF